MASAMRSHRAIAVGISGGFGLALPLVAYLATLPFGDTSNAVRADAVPFAAGALAGVGLMALSSYLIDASAAADDTAEQVDAKPEAASQKPARSARASETSVLKGVPIITRAVDALDEEEAWAEIDAMFADDSPISCDPIHSKDMYQIAFEELQRAEHERAVAATAQHEPATQADAPAPSRSVRADASSAAPVAAAETGRLRATVPAAASTATFIALAEHAPTIASEALSSAVAAAAAETQAAAEAAAAAAAEARESARDRAAAMASLGEAYAGAVGSSAATAAAAAATPVPQPAEEVVYTVPVADYSGHEAMWEAAVAILEELDAPSGSLAASSPAETAQMDARRMAELAEDGCVERDHRRVDAILEEEFDRMGSNSVRRTTHEYLRVIQGGTAAMPRLKAEA